MEKDQALTAKNALPIVIEMEAAPLALWVTKLLADTQHAVDAATALLQDGVTVERLPVGLPAEMEKFRAVVRHNALLFSRINILRGFNWPEGARVEAERAGRELSLMAAKLTIFTKELADLVAAQSSNAFTAPKP